MHNMHRKRGATRFQKFFFYSDIHSSPAESFEQCISYFIGIRWYVFLRHRQVTNDFPLAFATNLSIA